MTVRKVFWEDPYLTRLETTVAGVDGDAVRLASTIFFAMSGGQESDAGTIADRPVLLAEKDGLDAIGSSIAGAPFVVLGQNRYVTWGETTTGFDVTDTYLEKIQALGPDANGLPIEIYCFTNTVVWAEYEGIQADIFDHVFAVVDEFGLRIHQTPTGNDIRALAGAFSR